MNRTEAIAEANRFADAVLLEARGIIRDAIAYRRAKPARFALFHRRMAVYWESRHRPVKIAWHRYWEARYAAKAWALDQEIASACGIKGPA